MIRTVKSKPQLRLMVSDYVDSLITRIDISVEETIEEISKLAQEEPQSRSELNQRRIIRHEHNNRTCLCYSHWNIERPREPPADPNAINATRTRVINFLTQLRDEAMTNVTNKSNINDELAKSIADNPNDDQLDVTMEYLFGDKFPFVIVLKSLKSKLKFAAVTVITDFYLNSQDLDAVSWVINSSDKNQPPINQEVFNHKLVLISELARTIQKRLEEQKDGYEIMKLKKSELFNLKFLNLQSPKIKRVESIKLPSLRCLALCHHTIEYMAPNAFESLQSLESLFLFSNNMNLGPEHVNLFKPLTACRKLNLSFNHIEYLDPNCFDNMFNLIEMNISSNRVNFLSTNTSIFDSLVNLTVLNIGYNKMPVIMGAFFKNLTSLRSLTLRGCDATEIEIDAFKTLNQLKSLDLTSNLLTTLPKGVFNGLECLEDINFLNNNLTQLDDDLFDNLRNLKSIWLSSNMIKVVKAGWFKSLSNLKDFYIGNNELEAIEDNAFDNLTNLHKLDISFNSNLKQCLTTRSLFSKLVNLKTLSIENCDIDVIQTNMFEGLVNLETLNIARNNIKAITATPLASMVNLKKLNLSSNPIESFELDVVKVFSKIESIVMSRNEVINLEGFRTFTVNRRFIFSID